MSYVKTQWRNDTTPAINETNLNHIEQGIGDAHSELATQSQSIEIINLNIESINDNIDRVEGEIPEIVDNTQSTDTGSALSANMGRDLQSQIANLKNIGRFLAIWNASTGLPTSEPTETPYAYRTGDYFRIGVAGLKVPTGSTYVRGAYDTAEEQTGIGDVWYYDGTEWIHQASSGGGKVQDVQVKGTSVLVDGIANIPMGTAGELDAEEVSIPMFESDLVIPITAGGTGKQSKAEVLKEFNVYSTEEQVIGTWIDGKPIYRIVIQGTSSSSRVLLHNVDVLVNAYGRVAELFFGSIISDGNIPERRIGITLSSNDVSLLCGSWLSNNPFTFTFEYTKTTD